MQNAENKLFQHEKNKIIKSANEQKAQIDKKAKDAKSEIDIKAKTDKVAIDAKSKKDKDETRSNASELKEYLRNNGQDTRKHRNEIELEAKQKRSQIEADANSQKESIDIKARGEKKTIDIEAKKHKNAINLETDTKINALTEKMGLSSGKKDNASSIKNLDDSGIEINDGTFVRHSTLNADSGEMELDDENLDISSIKSKGWSFAKSDNKISNITEPVTFLGKKDLDPDANIDLEKNDEANNKDSGFLERLSSWAFGTKSTEMPASLESSDVTLTKSSMHESNTLKSDSESIKSVDKEIKDTNQQNAQSKKKFGNLNIVAAIKNALNTIFNKNPGWQYEVKVEPQQPQPSSNKSVVTETNLLDEVSSELSPDAQSFLSSANNAVKEEAMNEFASADDLQEKGWSVDHRDNQSIASDSSLNDTTNAQDKQFQEDRIVFDDKEFYDFIAERASQTAKNNQEDTLSDTEYLEPRGGRPQASFASTGEHNSVGVYDEIGTEATEDMPEIESRIKQLANASGQSFGALTDKCTPSTSMYGASAETARQMQISA